MGKASSAQVSLLAFFVVSAVLAVPSGATCVVGVSYGRLGNNLPSPWQVVQLLQSQGIRKVRIYDADSSVLQAFANSGIQLIIGIPDNLLPTMATDTGAAYNWVKLNVAAYQQTQITAIAVGNEILTSAPWLSSSVLPAMNNFHSALVNLKLDQQVKVSTTFAMNVLAISYPPSASAFNSTYSATLIHPILNFLSVTSSFVMVNIYPYVAYKDNPRDVGLNYALFLPTNPVWDSKAGLQYTNLFDAQVDAFYYATMGLNTDFKYLNIVVTETGWPSAGDLNELGSNIQNAEMYNGNIIKHIVSGDGTPLKPKVFIETYIFALFNENQKPGPTSERNYGLFFPNMNQVYNLNLTTGASTGSGDSSWSPKGTWCMAKTSGVSAQSLQAALDFACGPGSANCAAIQPGASCFFPNNIWAHASYAFNNYYQKNQRKNGTCFFGGVAEVLKSNPSSSNCIFPTQ